jgi:prepilin-type N-terminal cleavage/methylation domain-containing protein
LLADGLPQFSIVRVRPDIRSRAALRPRSERGFTLVELASVVLVMGIIFAFAVPSFQNMRRTYDLKGARDNIIAQIQMARAKAIATGIDQPIHFYTGSFGYDFHLHPSGVTAGWNLPSGVVYEWPSGSPMNVTMEKDGTANSSLMIPLANSQGLRDTVQVLASGLVLAQ